MKRFFGYILIFHLSLPLTGQVLRETYHDQEQKYIKETYYVTDTMSNILEGPYKSFYLSGQLESHGQFENNDAAGQWDFYYESGALKMRGMIDPSRPEDHWQYFFEQGPGEGMLRMEGPVIGQKRNGEWKFYFQNGQLKETGIYRDNLREGLWKAYYEDGQLQSETNYADNTGKMTEYYPGGEKSGLGLATGAMKTGHWTYFYKTGKTKAEGMYDQGKKTGAWTYYHPEGAVSATGEYSGGEATGPWSYFYDSGKLQSTGDFTAGKKEGLWKLYYPDGKLLGEGDFTRGDGPYKEFYPEGEVRILGQMKDGKSHGHWKYFFEDGTLEGECDFEYGQGTYSGYYKDGSLQTRGTIADGKRVGKWELYEKNGKLTGYYKPIYDISEVRIHEPRSRNYGVADYRFKGRKKGYFEPSLNEFKGLIVGFNPLMSLVGRMPFTLEYYMQERLGYELEVEGLRDPFFRESSEISIDKTYSRGVSVAFRQKFYNDGGRPGMWYFGHELRYSDLTHYANVLAGPDLVEVLDAKEQKIEYSLLLGYRIVGSKDLPGITLDTYVSAGSGFRKYNQQSKSSTVFNDLPQEKVTLRASYGIVVGYIFRIK